MPIMPRPSENTPCARPGVIVWFWGLPSSGKSTLATALADELRKTGQIVSVLDGDVLRSGLSKNLGFGEDDRLENIRRAAEVAKIISDLGITVVAAFITPLCLYRTMVREILGRERLRMVFVDCPLTVCMERDVKRLYAASKQGSLKQMSGIDSPFEVKIEADSDLVLRTDLLTVRQCVDAVVDLLHSEPH